MTELEVEGFSEKGNATLNQLVKFLDSIDLVIANTHRRTVLLDAFIKNLDEKKSWDVRGIKEAMVELAIHSQMAIVGEQTALSTVAIATAQIIKLLGIVEEKRGVEIQIPANVEKQLTLWTQRMEAAEKAQREYVK